MESIQISDELWKQIHSHIPTYLKSPRGGRPRLSLKKVFEGILFVKKNRLPWKAVPVDLGSKTALNDYYRAWAKAGVFHSLMSAGLILTPELSSLNSDWEKIDKLVENKVSN